MYQLIQNDTLFISEACPEALNAIPAAQYDKDGNIEDILKTDHLYDDVVDELRYGYTDMLNSKAKPYSVVMQETLEPIKDLTQKNLMYLKMIEKQRGRQRWRRQ